MTDWLLFGHLLSAFLLAGGAVAAGILQRAALGRERPSEVALLLRATRPAVLLVIGGALGALVFGVLLAHHLGEDFGQAWIAGALVLWVVAMVTGDLGGRPLRRARRLAESLAAEGDAPSGELRALVGDRRALVLNLVSSGSVAAILVLMVFKPT